MKQHMQLSRYSTFAEQNTEPCDDNAPIPVLITSEMESAYNAIKGVLDKQLSGSDKKGGNVGKRKIRLTKAQRQLIEMMAGLITGDVSPDDASPILHN